MDCIGRAVTFETSVIAAVAGFAVDVNGDVSDFGGGAVGTVIDRAIVDDAKTDAFAEQIVGEGSFGQFRIEQELCQGACACILLYKHRYVEGFAEFLDEIDFAPALHGGDECGMPFFDKVWSGDCHADCHDFLVFGDEVTNGVVDLFDCLVDVFFADGRKIGKRNTVAFKIEQTDLHQTACEFQANHMVFSAVEIQPDGTTILIAFHVASFFDDVLCEQFCRDFGDCRRSQSDCLCDLRT